VSKIVVLAGNQKQFDDFIRTRSNPELYVYGNMIENLLGIQAEGIETIGTFWLDVKNSTEIWDKARGML